MNVPLKLFAVAALIMAGPTFATAQKTGETHSSTMSPPSGNNDGGHGIGTTGSNTANNGTASSTINPSNSSLAAAPKKSPSAGGTSGTIENDPAIGGGAQTGAKPK